jgi:hypothetical protein
MNLYGVSMHEALLFIQPAWNSAVCDTEDCSSKDDNHGCEVTDVR